MLAANISDCYCAATSRLSLIQNFLSSASLEFSSGKITNKRPHSTHQTYTCIMQVSYAIWVPLSLPLIRLCLIHWGRGWGQKEAKQLIVSAWHLISAPQKVYYRSKTVIKPQQ